MNKLKSRATKTDHNVNFNRKGTKLYSVSVQLPYVWRQSKSRHVHIKSSKNASEQFLTVQRCSNWQQTRRKIVQQSFAVNVFYILYRGYVEIRLHLLDLTCFERITKKTGKKLQKWLFPCFCCFSWNCSTSSEMSTLVGDMIEGSHWRIVVKSHLMLTIPEKLVVN